MNGGTVKERRTGAAVSAAAFAVIALLVAICAVSVGYFLGGREKEENALGVNAELLPTVIIDAGHGGRDGGCVSYDGQVLEKECNLEIAKSLAALFRISGYNVIMTRESDEMLSSDVGGGSAKQKDLRARLEIARAYPDALFISVHCNKFPDADCEGLQVYYSKNHPSSAEYAEGVQSSVISLLQPTNKRLIKAAGSSIYLLDRAAQPAILVECGFLSNPEETVALSSPVYRKQLALAVMLGIRSAEQ